MATRSSSPSCAERVSLGGSVKKGMTPSFQSCSTARAAPARSASPPLRIFPRLRATSVRNSSAVSKRAMLYTSQSRSGAHLLTMAATAPSGSSICSTETQLRRKRLAAAAAAERGFLLLLPPPVVPVAAVPAPSSSCSSASASASVSAPSPPSASKMMPGQSSSEICESSRTSRISVVVPGTGDTCTARVRVSELISDDLPTLG